MTRLTHLIELIDYGGGSNHPLNGTPEMPAGVAWDVLHRSEEANRIKSGGAKRG